MATTFYGAVLGWRISGPDPHRTDGKDYRMIGRSDGGQLGGVFRLTPDMGAMPSMWVGYLSAVDVAATTAAIAAEAAQGEVVQAANDNGAGQVVVSGHKAAVERAVEIDRKSTRLNSSHT